MLLISSLALLLGIANALPTSINDEITSRIVGGKGASIKDHPYQAGLLYNNGIFEFGTGAIISKKWVVTAAHLLVQNSNVTAIRAGSASKLGGTIHKVDKIVVHEKFSAGDDKNLPENNIALLRVKTPFDFDQVPKPVELFNEKEKIKKGQVVQVAGWGGSETLKVSTVQVLTKDVCTKAFQSAGLKVVSTGQLCTIGYKNGPRYGDDGAPLVVDGRMAGVTSFFHIENLPGLYTEIATYRSWIKKHTKV